MAKQVINVGTSANDRRGDSLRAAFQKTNANFTELYDRAINTDAQTLTLNGNTLAITGGNSVELTISLMGDLTGSVFADDSTLLVDGVNGVVPAAVISGTLDYDTVPIEYLRLPEPGTSVTTPTPNSTGTKGQVIYSAGFVYICVASNTWVRVAAETVWE